jgi:hypothetical protein
MCVVLRGFSSWGRSCFDAAQGSAAAKRRRDITANMGRTRLACLTLSTLFALCVNARAAAQASPKRATATRPALSGLFGAHKPAVATEPELTAIASLLSSLERHGDARVAGGALADARQALGRARAAFARGDSDTEKRAKQLAWAALALGSRQIALAVAQRQHGIAEQRAKSAEAESARAQQELATARQAARAKAAVAP